MRQDLSLYRNPKGFRGRSLAMVQLWWIIQATLFKMSPQGLYRWRSFLLRCFGAKIGKNTIIRPSVTITYPWRVEIGDNSWIGDDVVLYSLGEIQIGSNTVISQKGYICTGTHDYTKKDFPITTQAVIIKDQCWLATDVFVAPGVIIESKSVVGARSSVFHNLDEDSIYIGSPAKFIKKR